MWHTVWHSRTVWAGSSCYCAATKNHYLGDEVYPPTPLGVRMTDINNKRQALSSLYGPQWAAKVKAMSDAQVVALFLKFKNEGKIK